MGRVCISLCLGVALCFGTACSGSSGPVSVEDLLVEEVRRALDGTPSPEMSDAHARVLAELSAGELAYLGAVAWQNIDATLVLSDPVFRRAMSAAAVPGRDGPPYGGAQDTGILALSNDDLTQHLKDAARTFAAVGVTAVGLFACAGSFTGITVGVCAAAIAYVASALMPANAGEPHYDELPEPDTPADNNEYKENVDPSFECPVGYEECGESFCVNLASVHRHCGRCGNVCASGLCVDGECVGDADAGIADAGMPDADLLDAGVPDAASNLDALESDASTCSPGSCGNVCYKEAPDPCWRPGQTFCDPGTGACSDPDSFNVTCGVTIAPDGNPYCVACAGGECQPGVPDYSLPQ